ncbi:MAG: hypothetical protein J6B51_10610 [Clostridia bacterium]|nr:hypothetical protein [Clostridia bacterium]
MDRKQIIHELVMLILKNMDLSDKSSEEIVDLYFKKTAEVKAEYSKKHRENVNWEY